MKRLLFILCIIEATPTYAAASAAGSLIPVKIRYTHETALAGLAEPKKLVETYTIEELKRFGVFRHMFEDIEAGQNTELIPLPEPTMLPTDFGHLVRMANPGSSYQERMNVVIEMKSPNHLLHVYNTAFVLNPVDKRTMYPAVLMLWAHINYLAKYKRQAFLEQQPVHTTSQLVDDVNTLIVDTKYTPNDAQEPLREAVLTILTTPHLIGTLTNNQTQALINDIKKRIGKKGTEKSKFINRIHRYLGSKLENGKFPAVPQGAGVKPKAGYFPLSLKDLDDYDYMPPVTSTVLDLSNENLTSLEPEILSKFSHVQEIDLGRNYLTILEPGVFTNLPALQKVKLWMNKLTTLQVGVFANLPKLQELDLSVNKLTTLEAEVFNKLPTLQWINLKDNGLTTIQSGVFVDLPELRKLDLSVNKLTTLKKGVFDNLPKLQEFYLNNNKLAALEVRAFTNLPELRELFLHNNHLTTLEPGVFTNLPRLQKINLWNNELITLKAGVFANLPVLQKIDLSGNNLTTLDPKVFVNLPKLQELDLRCNKLTTLDPEVFANLPALQEINLSNNPLEQTEQQIRDANPTLPATCKILGAKRSQSQ